MPSPASPSNQTSRGVMRSLSIRNAAEMQRVAAPPTSARVEEVAHSAREKLNRGMAKLKSMRAFGGLSSHNLLTTAVAAAEVSRDVANTDVVVEATAGPARLWEAGTLPDRISRVRALAKRDFLQNYLHQLEFEIVELQDDPQSSRASTEDAITEEDGKKLLTADQAATVDVYRQNLQANMLAIQDSLDRSQQLYLSRASTRDEARGRVAELEAVVEAKQNMLGKVLKAERRHAALLDGTDDGDDDAGHGSSDDDGDLDVSNLPKRKDLEADIAKAARLLSEARATLAKAEEALAATNARLQKLQEQLNKAMSDHERVSTAKGGAAFELASAAASRAAAVAAASAVATTPVARRS
jgi:DNA primase